MRNDNPIISELQHVQLRFPMRRSTAIWVSSSVDGWLVRALDHGWIHGTFADAVYDASWLSQNLDLPIRSAIRSS